MPIGTPSASLVACRGGASTKTMRTAYATIKGFEVMLALRKGQGHAFNLTRDPIGEKRMIERAFGVGPCVMTEAMTLIEEHFKAVA